MMRAARCASRITFVAAFIAMTSATLSVAPACGGGATCDGSMWLTCEALKPDWCAKAKGCFAVEGRCGHICAEHTDQGTCDQDSCIWDGSACQSSCGNGDTEEECLSFLVSSPGTLDAAASIPDCVWDGQKCVSPCPSFTTSEQCMANPLYSCHWFACAGTPKGPCSSYSGDDCPTFLGCDRTDHPIISTQ